jgi:hypothetical protein
MKYTQRQGAVFTVHIITFIQKIGGRMNNRRRAEIMSLMTQIENVKAAIEQAQGQFDDITSTLETATDEENGDFNCLSENAQESDFGVRTFSSARALENALTTFKDVDETVHNAVTDLDDALILLKSASK